MSGITNPEYGLVTDAICRQTDMNKLRDGFRSFPSGHSSCKRFQQISSVY